MGPLVGRGYSEVAVPESRVSAGVLVDFCYLLFPDQPSCSTKLDSTHITYAGMTGVHV